MASPSGLFYAYAKHTGDDVNYRYLITFASRAVADEWWRAITTSVQKGHTKFSHIVRHSPQFYSYDINAGNIMLTLTDPKINSGDNNFLNRVFFNIQHNRDQPNMSPAPVLSYTDHRNNGYFHVRSLCRPELFWFYDKMTERLRPSLAQRTKFNIRIADRDQQLGNNVIMIGSDKVIIAVAREEIGLGGNRNQELIGGFDSGHEFLFADFDGGFDVQFPPLSEGTDEELQKATIVRTGAGRGDRWQLL